MDDNKSKLKGTPATVKKKEAFLEAAIQVRSNKTKAAEAAGINVRTVHRWLQDDPEFSIRYKDSMEPVIDQLIDRGLMAAMGMPKLDKNGELIEWIVPPNTQLLTLYLKSLARDRGFVDRAEVDLNTQIPIIHNSEAVARLVKRARNLR